MRATKSLLIGASGQVGGQMLKILPSDDTLLTSRSPAKGAHVTLDLAHLDSLEDAQRHFDGYDLNAIYCVGGMTNVEACEDAPELAHWTNCRGPGILAMLAEDRSIPFVYFSTEYVFDGSGGPYSENRQANPLSVYGKSKWDGEQAVLAACSSALVLRTTVVYGQDSGLKNYVYSVIRALTGGQPMRVPEDQISTPTYNKDLATAAVVLASRRASGVYHLCGPERMSRLTFAQKIAAHFNLDACLLRGVSTEVLGQKAPRPLSAGLTIDKLKKNHPDILTRAVKEGLSDSQAAFEGFIASCIRLERLH